MPREVRRNTLLHIPDMPAPRTTHWDDEDEDDSTPRVRKRWFHYIPLFLAVLLMLLPHPSLLLVLVNYHLHHHCYWLGDKCIGHRTYAAFLHLLTCIVLLSVYIAALCVQAVYFAFTNPLASYDENTPLHDIYLAFTGSTNQTTLENVSPFLLLRHLPPLPRSSSDAPSLPDAPLEHQLSHAQRRLVRDAHFHVRNWAQVAGWDRPWGWVHKLLVGGGCKGDGQTFPRNPRADNKD
ncbi:uncharacterized protein B0H18DRAFT_1017433 [Fomitopsis serialis]|uniref:uncharacterized protein n=1 Tax=Fomitopsis serialis TaxID=139415 RepID=UPI002007C599|nr:uncharacterized protein B0H18DRAFT_1017433 [Neoantrodia serialis]KAH9922678.1 hypothetical protein B0H18DRAFT_1017433 [Neoantrodia serialis]